MILLEGITWNHTRGFVPKVAAAQRFAELNPGVEIRWSKRSLLDFGEYPVEKLAERFDLLVIDHPYVGFAAEHALFRPLDGLLPADVLGDLALNSVGASHRSYRWENHQWALPVDAACPVAHWRPDLLDRAGVPVPQTWAEVQALIRRGHVIAPLIHTDAIHVFYMFCHALGETPFAAGGDAPFVSRATGLAALELGRELAAALPAACLAMNPIAALETLAHTDDAWYCPFAFGYSNYARPHYAPHLVASGEPVRWLNDVPLVTTLGGTGIAITPRCAHPEVAARFAAFLTSPTQQRGLYFEAGGQPAHLTAWLDDQVNRNSHDFFRRTLPALDRAWLRPRYAGYLHFQDHGSYVIADTFRGTLSAATALDRLEALHRESLLIPQISFMHEYLLP